MIDSSTTISNNLSRSGEYTSRAEKLLLIVPGNQIVFTHADGVYLYDESGKRYLDATARSGVVSFGHNNPLLREADLKMSEKGTQFFQTIGDHWRVEITVDGRPYEISPANLAQILVDATFGGDAFVIPKETGATANNAFIKLAGKLRPKRNVFASIQGAYHGRSGYADALTDTKPLHKSPYPSSFVARYLPFIETQAHLAMAREELFRAGFENLNILAFEGVQSEGGMRHQDFALFHELATEAQAKGAYLLADDVWGLYRSGKRFSYEHYGLRPDAIAMAKALGQGAPASAVILRQRVFDEAGISVKEACPKAWEGGTFTWTPSAVARAIVTMTNYDKPEVGAHVLEMAEYFETKVLPILTQYGGTTETSKLTLTGLGLMRGIRFGDVTCPMPQLRDETRRQLISNGISISGVGNDQLNPTIRFTPPLIIQKQHIDEFTQALERSLRAAWDKVGPK